jgi:hypothetical protein
MSDKPPYKGKRRPGHNRPKEIGDWVTQGVFVVVALGLILRKRRSGAFSYTGWGQPDRRGGALGRWVACLRFMDCHTGSTLPTGHHSPTATLVELPRGLGCFETGLLTGLVHGPIKEQVQWEFDSSPGLVRHLLGTVV